MKTEITRYVNGKWLTGFSPSSKKQLVLVHADCQFLAKSLKEIEYLETIYPNAHVVTSCAKTLHGETLAQHACQVAAIDLEGGEIAVAATNGDELSAEGLIKQLPSEKLTHIHLILDSAKLDTHKFLKDCSALLDPNVTVSGSISLSHPEQPYHPVFLQSKPQHAIAIGFYQPMEVHSKLESGWKSFGLPHTVTKSKGNWLLEINGEPALEMLKDYFGPLSHKLPKIAHIHPLHASNDEDDPKGLDGRSVVEIDKEKAAVYMASHIPKGSQLRFMMTTPQSLRKSTEHAVEPLHQLCVNEGKESGFLLANLAITHYYLMQERSTRELHLLDKITEHGIASSVIYSHGQIFRRSNGQLGISNLGLSLTLF